VPSCFGSGKDWIAARIGAWWVATGGILVVTSNTFSQLRDVYWRELRKAHAKGGLPGQPTWGTDLRWDLGEGSWAIGRKPDDNDPEGLQGIHGERVLVIVDEANGVSPQLWEATRGLVVNAASASSRSATRGSRRVPSTRPARAPNWHVIPISVFDTPNFTGEPVPAKAQAELVGPQWLDDAKADGLEGTPWWQAKVLGQFPDTASDQVIPLSLVETARANAHTPDAREAAGLDVARFGSDDTALVEGSQATGPSWSPSSMDTTRWQSQVWALASSLDDGACWPLTREASAEVFLIVSVSSAYLATSSASTPDQAPTTTPTTD
jgi:hypothetical protein